jgi:hypothetical protein
MTWLLWFRFVMLAVLMAMASLLAWMAVADRR